MSYHSLGFSFLIGPSEVTVPDSEPSIWDKLREGSEQGVIKAPAPEGEKPGTAPEPPPGPGMPPPPRQGGFIQEHGKAIAVTAGIFVAYKVLTKK